MKFGVMMFTTDYSMAPHKLAIAVEERGFESLWFPEHSHIPLPRVSSWPGGGELPKMYYDVMDPFVALGAAASVTNSLKLGTGICLVVQRDPIQLAKEVSTIDQLSNGRFLFGIGAGWNAEEMADHGTTDFKGRFKLMNERVAALRTIWSENKPEYHGDYVDFGPMMTWPKPVQKPHPPIIVGGGFPHAARRAIAYGDGWMPIGGRLDVVDLLPQFRQMLAESGREPDQFPVTSFGLQPEPDKVSRTADAGVYRVIFALPAEKSDTVLPLLDSYAAIAAKHSN
ncbi:MAG: LLM class F420-dependent oxidoreductase [Rhodospirillaceae bacterium]|nr:LLM class F420-dependent oxidoreductase [Rhodospirillaceae bacterium]|tara:strand:- start:2506 stop:3354 length:849 start_codon:yes stop_codon:yes gene_type:complete